MEGANSDAGESGKEAVAAVKVGDSAAWTKVWQRKHRDVGRQRLDLRGRV